MHLATNIVNQRKTVDQKAPRRFSHIRAIGSRAEINRQREIDLQNQKLLNSIMNIMKRKNKSVQQARKTPSTIIGGEKSV